MRKKLANLFGMFLSSNFNKHFWLSEIYIKFKTIELTYLNAFKNKLKIKIYICRSLVQLNIIPEKFQK